MSLGELVAQVDEQSLDIAPLPRGVPDRHRSLRALLEWSINLLDDDEKALLGELAVFAGPVTAEDVEAALARPGAATTLRRLVGRSLVEADRSTTPTRYGLLQTVRDHGRSRLVADGMLDRVAQRHAEWCRAVVVAESRRILGAEEGAARRRLAALLPEIRAAYTFARRADRDLAGEMVGALYDYARQGLVDEPLRWAEELVAEVGPEQVPPTVVISAAGRALTHGDLDRARQLSDLALRTAPDQGHRALDVRGDADLFAGDLDEAASSYEEMAALAAQAADEVYEALAWTGLAISRAYGGDRASAAPALDRLRGRSFENPTAAAWARYASGEATLDADPATALVDLDAAVTTGRAAESWYVTNMAAISGSSLRTRCGDPQDALDRIVEVITTLHSAGDRAHLVTVLRNLVVLLDRIGATESVAVLNGFVEQDPTPSFGAEADLLERVTTASRARLADGRWAELEAAGAAMDLGDIVAWSLDEVARIQAG